MHRLHNHLHALHHTGSQTENPVVIPEEPEEQFEVIWIPDEIKDRSIGIAADIAEVIGQL